MENGFREETVHRTTVDAAAGKRLVNWGEIWRYRDLLYFLVWRDFKTRYSQSVLGIIWTIIPPVVSMIVFTVVFGGLAEVDSDGVPYAIFSFTALVPWTYFAGSFAESGTSLTSASGIISKVYFPRLIVPLAPVFGKLIDFAISMVLLLGMMAWFRIMPTPGVLFLPALILLMMITAAGMGMWLTTLAVQYRDVSYAIGFIAQILMFAAPVVYPASAVPEQFRLVYSLFPMAGVIEGFRSALLGTNPMPWDMILVGTISGILIIFSGAAYFGRMERIFADVV